MIIIDDIEYDVPIESMEALADMLDKYAERTNDGTLHRELIGVYDNYEITFTSSNVNQSIYAALWWKLTEPTPWHKVVLPTVLGTREIWGYFANTKHRHQV